MFNIYKKIFLSFFNKSDLSGVLIVIHDQETYKFGLEINNEEDKVREADIKVLDDKFFKQIIFNGDIGLGEAYFLNYFETSSLKKLLKWFLQNKKSLPGFNEKGKKYLLFEWAKIVSQVMHKLNKNTKRGSKRNIHEHYDVSNDFYKLWLDETMTYSAAVFENTNNLHEAQIRKYEKICQKVDLKSSDHVLEIGTGWGGFAIYVATKYNCHITTTTISKEQYKLANERIKGAGLSDKIELILKDYRDLEGKYDKIVSIEMMEALGHEYVSLFVDKCEGLLKHGGKICYQCITIPDKIFKDYLRNNNYIKKYIFPGGELISVGQLKNVISNHKKLHVDEIERIGLDYAKTLHAWAQNLKAHKEEVIKLGFDEVFYQKVVILF
jgi:cyclopropane-fatty-acyl-phospholipid synthase